VIHREPAPKLGLNRPQRPSPHVQKLQSTTISKRHFCGSISCLNLSKSISIEPLHSSRIPIIAYPLHFTMKILSKIVSLMLGHIVMAIPADPEQRMSREELEAVCHQVICAEGVTCPEGCVCPPEIGPFCIVPSS
jgi:hypothetical protein